MPRSESAVVVEGLRRFLKLHASCAGAALDTPALPDGIGYRVVLACRCGDTVEYWVKDAVLAPEDLVAAVSPRRVA